MPPPGVWGAPKNPAGQAMCPTAGWVNGTCSVANAGLGACAVWTYTNASGSVVPIVPPVTGYYPNTPAPCWANTAPTSYSLPAGQLTYNGYSVADASGTTQVPHFLDYGSVLYKDVNAQVHRQAIPAGQCLPGNLLNVRTSATQFFAATPSVAPAYPPAKSLAFPTGANQIYTTSNDVKGQGLTWYTPASTQATPANMTGDGSAQPATLGTIRVYFALNFGLRNALDNACDGRTKATTAACVNGGYYASNLTTALLGDASKGLGRATYAVIKLCHSPISTLDRPWRKRSGDAVNNKQCMDVKQLLFGADSEKMVSSPNVGVVGTPNAGLVSGSDILVFQPLNAQTGLAVNNMPFTNFTSGNFAATGAASVVGAYVTNTSAGLNVPTPSPVAFCRPASSSSYASGVDPSKAAGVQFNAATGVCTQSASPLNSTAVDCYTNCVLNGTSWSATKGTNVNLNDPAWYSVDIVLSRCAWHRPRCQRHSLRWLLTPPAFFLPHSDMPQGNYFVRVFALDAQFNYLGFGSSAGSANLTNTAAQNFFYVDRWASWTSAGVVGGMADIRAGAAGCSALSLFVATIFLVREVRASRERQRRTTEVVVEEEPVKAAALEPSPAVEAH